MIKLPAISNDAKRGLRMFMHKLYKHRADIAFFGGTGLTAVGTGIFVKNSIQTESKVIETHKVIMAHFNKEFEEGNITEEQLEEIRKETTKETIKSTAKTYALPTAVSAVGYALQIYSHKELKSDLSTASLALSSMTAAYEALKEKYIENQGADAWEENVHGVKVEGKGKNKEVIFDSTRPDAHSILFYEPNPNWNPNKGANKAFLLQQQNAMNFLLQKKGVLFEHEVLSALGFEVFDLTAKGQMNPAAGWVYKNPDGTMNYISFGLDRPGEAIQRFNDELEPSVMLEFNCVDNIYDYI